MKLVEKNMGHCLIKKIDEVDDDDFQTFITELCVCFDLSDEGVENESLLSLFSAFVTEQKKPDLKRLATDQILSQKIKELALESMLHDVCSALMQKYGNGKGMDDFAGKSMFALIKHCYKSAVPKPSGPKKPSRLQKAHQFKKELIRRGRESGSYS